MKRSETLMLENLLDKDTIKNRLYGCKEIPIGFYNSGKCDEIVDYMTMSSKGILKCYELKVSLQDLKSSAKKSFYGHYNYLVVTKELYDKITDWPIYIPNYVGIIIGYKSGLDSVRKAKRQNISNDTETMLKESMVRSLYWKMQKYKDARSIEEQKRLKSKIREKEKDIQRLRDRAVKAEHIISDYETYKYCNDGIEIDLEEESKKEKERNKEKRRKELK